MKYVLEREQIVPMQRDKVFEFFSAAENLDRLTPTSLHFKILTPSPIDLKTGAIIDYRLSLFGIPFGWRTLIETFEPNDRFVDKQLKGPYRLWRHLHEFSDASGGTHMFDRVEYEVPFGPIGEVARVLFVKRQVESIFDFRREACKKIFA